ncbi:MAG: hypothetical protein KJ600_04635 [Nanoarchaeota archaeon]|nr:hypothetical protein [Nanoarchaeota archaeon]MBU1103815.1 hypothetical protein [Nanoarchaeota archaeon]
MKNELIKTIKQKKELSGLVDSVVKTALNNYLNKYRIELANLSQKQKKIIVKDLRAELRILTGRFQKSLKNREKLFKEGDFQKILKTHSSTAERLEFYPELKKIVASLKPASILDLGCGLNPLALANPKIKYHASDIKQDELSLVKKFFKKNKIKGETFICDLRNLKKNLPRADLCLLFKVLDVIEKKHARKILTTVPCTRLIVSFSTRKLSGKPMNFPKRIWFEVLLKKLNFPFKTFKSENEVFYFVEKGS